MTLTTQSAAVSGIRVAYHAAADTYDHAALSFWTRFGEATVGLVAPQPGERILDVCCGSGASALPAAQLVGPRGRVVAVDLAAGLLDLGRRKAAVAGLHHIEWEERAFETLAEPAGSFDAVVCVFGVFFAPDPVDTMRRLWRWVRPGGRLAVTTWGPRVFEPANSVFWDAVRAVRPELYKSFNPWDRISDPTAVLELFTDAGVPEASATLLPGTHPLRTPDDWWAIVMGSGYRGTVDRLTLAEQHQVRARVLDRVRQQGITSVETNVIFALAGKRT